MGQIVGTISWEASLSTHAKYQKLIKLCLTSYGLHSYICKEYNVITPPPGIYTDRKTIPRIQDYTGFIPSYYKEVMDWCSVSLEEPWITMKGGTELIIECIKTIFEELAEQLSTLGALNVHCGIRVLKAQQHFEMVDNGSYGLWKAVNTTREGNKSYGTCFSTHSNGVV